MKKYAYFPLLLAASTMMFSCGGGDAPSSSKTDGGSSATSAVPENQATVTIDAQGGVFSDGTSTKQMTVTKGVEFTIEETPTKEGYVFSGWADGVNAISKWSYDGRWTTNRDVTIYAHYKGAPHTVTLSSSNEDFGTVSATGLESDGTARNGAKITFQATPKTGYALEGWYIDEELVSTKDEYEFTMPNKDINVVGKFWTEGENGLRLLGASPAYWPETQTYTYGMYPQTWAGAEITAEIRKDGHPLGGGYYTYGEKLYLEAKSSDGAADYKFDDGTKMESSTDYFFLCEAISWIALTSGDGSHYACSEKVLDSMRYSEYYREEDAQTRTDYKGDKGLVDSNNYKFSDIRTWLNVTFFQNAFVYGNSAVRITEVDNSAASTGFDENKYSCANTDDKVTLLSSKEVDSLGKNIGAVTTDYARATGAQSSKREAFLNKGTYWTRSPSNSNRGEATGVSYDGSKCTPEVSSSYIGVRPAITFDL